MTYKMHFISDRTKDLEHTISLLNRMKKVTLNVPNYSPDTGVALNWEGNFTIKVSDINGSVSIEANTEGLISLANHLLNLSQSSVPIGTHLHLDEYNSLEEGSLDLIIEKI